MGTVVALPSQGGVTKAGYRQTIDEGVVTGRRIPHVLETNTVGAGVVGEVAGIQTFQRELSEELRWIRIDYDGEVGIDKLGRIAARLADRSNVAAVIAGYDVEGSVRLREIGPDGGMFDQTAVALGDGAELAAGQLSTVEPDLDLDATVTTVAEILEIVVNRDGRPNSSDGDDINL